MARAQIGPTGYGRYGILWKDFPYMEARGGYSGPFETYEAAEQRAKEIMDAYLPGQKHQIENIPTVNP